MSSSVQASKVKKHSIKKKIENIDEEDDGLPYTPLIPE